MVVNRIVFVRHILGWIRKDATVRIAGRLHQCMSKDLHSVEKSQGARLWSTAVARLAEIVEDKI